MGWWTEYQNIRKTTDQREDKQRGGVRGWQEGEKRKMTGRQRGQTGS